MAMRPLLKRASALALTAAALGGAGCGDEETEPSAAEPARSVTAATDYSEGVQSALELSAFEPSPKRYTIMPSSGLPPLDEGRTRLVLRVAPGAKHDHAIAIAGQAVRKAGPPAAPGSVSTLTVALRPGRYVFYCPIGDHRQKGMKGSLRVQALAKD